MVLSSKLMRRLPGRLKVFGLTGAALLTLAPTLATGAPTGSSDAFSIREAQALGGETFPAVAWRTAGGLVAEQAGRYLLLNDRTGQWTEINGTPLKVKRSAITTAANGMLHVIDGRTRVTLSLARGRVVREDEEGLPVSLRLGGAVFSRGSLYAAGLAEDGQPVFTRDSVELPVWSKDPFTRLLMAESGGSIYVFTGDDKSGRLNAYVYEPSKSSWSALGCSPFDVPGDKAFSCGDAHIIVLGGGKMAAFYATQKLWVEYQLPDLPTGQFALAHDHTRFDVVTPELTRTFEAVFPATKYGLFDHSIVIAFFLVMLWIGKALSKQEKSEGDFFRGGQRLPWWALGLSLFATGASAISLMAMPAKAYTENWIYLSMGFMQILMLPLLFGVLLPIARRLQFKTAFEYLEVRFSHSVRILGNLKYILFSIFGRMATIMVLPSIALSAICGMPVEVSIIVMGVVTTIYCMMGGFEAVVWTDVVQAVVVLLAMILCAVWILVSLDTSVPDAWQLIAVENKLQIADFSWDITQPIIYIILITTVFDSFGALSNQNFIQRVQATHTENDARKAIVTQLAVAVPMNVLLFGLGTLFFLYYNTKPEEITPAMKADGIFPLFAAQNLPTGLAGIVVAALMAATMSTLSSAINSVANVGVEDYIRRFKPDLSDWGALCWGKGLTLFLGLLGTGIALWLVQSNMTSVWDMFILIAGIFFAPMTGVYMLGLLTTRANTIGAWSGMIIAIGASLYVQQNLTLHPFFFGPISITICFVSGYLVSLLFSPPTRDLAGCTIYSLPPKLKND
jgi:SSS family transporter